MTVSSAIAPRPQAVAWRWIARILILIALVIPRVLAYSFAGGLWRDEVHSVNMATMPADDLFFVLTNDSIPMCWQSLLRTWITVFGSSDKSVRVLGLLIGLAVIPAMWWSARQFGVAFPWWLMILMGLDPSLIVYGGEVRGYGLGIVMFLILVGMSWRTLQHPSTGQWIGLAIVAVLAVQSSFTNCFLLAATLIACGLVALRRGHYRACVGFGLTGILAATTMLPYALYVFPRLSQVVNTVHDPVHWKRPIEIFEETYKWGGKTRSILGIVIGLVAFVELVRRLSLFRSTQAEQTVEDQNLALFLPPFFWIGTAGFWFYMYFLGVQTANWYHVPWLTLLAITTQLGMELWSRYRPRYDSLMVGLAMVAGVAILFEVTHRVRYRLTTVDLIARDLSSVVREGDLIVVTPWYVGITFGRYYHGPAEWTNLPGVDHIDHHLGYEEQKLRVMPLPAELGIKDELQKIETVLQAGGKVWWVGPLTLLPPGTPPMSLTGAPHPKYGWSESAYMTSWQQVAISRMQEIGIRAHEVTVARPRRVNPCENPSLFVIEPTNLQLSLGPGGQQIRSEHGPLQAW